LAEILNLLFERTSKGTRITEAVESSLDSVIRRVLPVLTTSTAAVPGFKSGPTDSATVSLTLPFKVT
jgi:hypothetical protein